MIPIITSYHIIITISIVLNKGRYQCTLDVDLPQYLFPSLVTGDDLRPDMLISTPSNTLYVLELSVGFETNLDDNVRRKFTKYCCFLNDLTSKYRHNQVVNLSIGSLGIFGQPYDSFIQMCSDLTIGKAYTNYFFFFFVYFFYFFYYWLHSHIRSGRRCGLPLSTSLCPGRPLAARQLRGGLRRCNISTSSLGGLSFFFQFAVFGLSGLHNCLPVFPHGQTSAACSLQSFPPILPPSIFP